MKHLEKSDTTPTRLGLVQAGWAKGAKTGKNRQIKEFQTRGVKNVFETMYGNVER